MAAGTRLVMATLADRPALLTISTLGHGTPFGITTRACKFDADTDLGTTNV